MMTCTAAGNTSERRYSMYFRINEQEPWKVDDLDLRTYVKLKLNDNFALEYVKDTVPNYDSDIEGLLRSIDGVDYLEVVIPPKSPIADDRNFALPANLPVNNGTRKSNAMECSDDLEDAIVSSSQDKTTEHGFSGVSAGVDNTNHETQNTSKKKDDNTNQLKFECERHPQLDGKFFAVVYEESNIDGTIVAKCQLCKNHKKIRGSLKALSNYTTHLKRVHDDEYTGYKSYIHEKRAKLIEDGPSKRAACKFSQTKFEENVTNYILESMAPLRTVDMSSFRKIFDDFDIRKNAEPLKHLSRRTLGRKIVENFEDRMTTIRNDIDQKAVTVCTTADVWSNNCRRFLGVTAHWIDPLSLRRESAAIACRRFSGIHSYDRIAGMLTEIHSAFNLDTEKVLAVVTDNGSNFVKAFKVFGVNMPDDFFFRSSLAGLASGCRVDTANEDDESASDLEHPTIAEDTATYENMPDNERQNVELPKHFRCASHTLNLIAAHDVLKAIKCNEQLSRTHDEVMDRCTELWRVTRSPKKHEILKEAFGVALLKPVIVRWNSLYDALAQLIALKDKIPALSETIGIRYPLRDSDFKYIENYVECLRPIAEAVDKLQGEDFCHYGFLLPTLITTARKLQMLAEKNTLQSYLPIIQNLITGLETRFANFFQIEKEGEYAAIAAISHPRFKAHWLGFFPGNIQEKVRTVVINAAQYELQADVLSPHESEIQHHSDFFDFGPSTATFGRSNTTFRNEDPEVQIIQYTKERCTDLTLLESYPLIKKLFVRYNTPLPSSAPVERLFSFATMMDLPKYNRLSDTNFERRVLSVANARYGKKKNSK